jgi:hypothetical protein
MFDIGVALPSKMLSDAERVTLYDNFTAVTPENSMKADAIHSDEGRYDFREAEKRDQSCPEKSSEGERPHSRVGFTVPRLVFQRCREAGQGPEAR